MFGEVPQVLSTGSEGQETTLTTQGFARRHSTLFKDGRLLTGLVLAQAAAHSRKFLVKLDEGGNREEYELAEIFQPAWRTKQQQVRPHSRPDQTRLKCEADIHLTLVPNL